MVELERHIGSEAAQGAAALAGFVSALEVASPPKQRQTARSSATSRYYAGFAEQFVADLLPQPNGSSPKTVLDPWMGSGTTMRVAHALGHRAVGIDLNPAMVVIARARLLTEKGAETASAALRAVLHSPTPRARVAADDPLLQWFDRPTTGMLRGLLERALPKLGGPDARVELTSSFEALTATESYVLASVFLAVRRLLASFIGSNPTWVKRGANGSISRVSWSSIRVVVEQAANDLRAEALDASNRNAQVELRVASSRDLPGVAKSATWVVSSPPYCTRIDYAVASRPELAVLGVSLEAQDRLRREMLGTTTVPKSVEVSSSRIGNGASSVLQAVSEHGSRASGTYYKKWLAQYLDGLAGSLDQVCALDRLEVLALVVQDSHYKEIRMDLASIIVEMCGARGWTLAGRRDFAVPRTKATINPGTRKYRSAFDATESVLVLGKEPSGEDGGLE